MVQFIHWQFVVLPCLASSDLPLYEIGSDWRALGGMAARRVRDYYRISPNVLQLRHIMQNKNVSLAFDRLVTWHSDAFPLYTQELRDMALGAGLEFQDLAVYSFKNELLAVYGAQTPDIQENECSDVLVHDVLTRLHGHNEDGEKELSNFSYLVKTDDFEAMTYPGTLAGGAFAFNRHGLVLTMNALSPKDAVTDPGCVGKYWLGRAVLDAESVQQAIKVLNRSCHAFGMSLNVGSTVTRELVNIEVAPGHGLSVQHIMEGSYFHANKYLRLNTSQDPHLSPSSAHRESRAKQLMPATDRGDVLRILGDTEDVHWPIFRTMGHGDYAVTLATAFFDYNNGTLDIWSGSNPMLTQPVMSRRLHSDESGGVKRIELLV